MTDLIDFANWLYDMDKLKLNNQIPPFESPQMIVGLYLKVKKKKWKVDDKCYITENARVLLGLPNGLEYTIKVIHQYDVEYQIGLNTELFGKDWITFFRTDELIPMENEKKFSKKFTLSFAKHCMITLLTTKHEGTDIPEISSLDLHRIRAVLEKFKQPEPKNLPDVKQMSTQELEGEMDILWGYLYLNNNVGCYHNFDYNGLDYWDAGRRHQQIKDELLLRAFKDWKNPYAQ